jgi:hypothetical protein
MRLLLSAGQGAARAIPRPNLLSCWGLRGKPEPPAKFFDICALPRYRSAGALLSIAVSGLGVFVRSPRYALRNLKDPLTPLVWVFL